jgi:apolipoprotein D and lipocalin family protein
MPSYPAWIEKLCSRTGVPYGVRPVRGLDIGKYLGTWYEIARLEHSFERGISRATANYTLAPDGSVVVLNSGFEERTGRTKTARAKASFVDARDVGHIKVSFFGPFFGSYIIFDLDADYSRAMVCGHDKSYLWILARKPKLDESVVLSMTTRAQDLGFPVEKLVFPTPCEEEKP